MAAALDGATRRSPGPNTATGPAWDPTAGWTRTAWAPVGPDDEEDRAADGMRRRSAACDGEMGMDGGGMDGGSPVDIERAQRHRRRAASGTYFAHVPQNRRPSRAGRVRLFHGGGGRPQAIARRSGTSTRSPTRTASSPSTRRGPSRPSGRGGTWNIDSAQSVSSARTTSATSRRSSPTSAPTCRSIRRGSMPTGHIDGRDLLLPPRLRDVGHVRRDRAPSRRQWSSRRAGRRAPSPCCTSTGLGRRPHPACAAAVARPDRGRSQLAGAADRRDGMEQVRRVRREADEQDGGHRQSARPTPDARRRWRCACSPAKAIPGRPTRRQRSGRSSQLTRRCRVRPLKSRVRSARETVALLKA